MSKIVGLPCVGGKSQLAPYLCDVIESECRENNIRKFISGCGGGGKIIFAIDQDIFDEVLYNEYETGLADLVEMLAFPNEVYNKEDDILIDNIDRIRYGIKKIIENKIMDESGEIIRDSSERELKLRNLFKEIREEQISNTKAAHGGEGVRLDKMKSAIYETILIYGSVQHNRKAILYRSKDGKRDFYNDMVVNPKYPQLLRKIVQRAENVKVRNDDVIKIVNENINNEDVFIYIDPPYWNCTNDYENTFDFDKHIELIKACKNSKSKIMISMHAFGIAPYLLGLFEQDNWHMYATPVIPHVSRNIKVSAKGELLFQRVGLKQVCEIAKLSDYNGEPKIIDNRTIQEYIFCNFETFDAYEGYENKKFYEIVPDNDDEIRGHKEPEDDFSVHNIFVNMVFTLYKEKKAIYKCSDNEIYQQIWDSILNAISVRKLEEQKEFILDKLIRNDAIESIKSIIEERTNFQKKRKNQQK